MNRRTTGSVALAAGLALGLAPALALAQAIGVQINGQPVYFRDARPTTVNGRVLVPLRGVLEQMGAYVEWMPATQTVVASRGNTDIRLPIGARSVVVDGRNVALDVPAMTMRGRTMVPLRFVSEALGADVAWNAGTQTVMIDTNGAPTTASASRNRRFQAYRSDGQAGVRSDRQYTRNARRDVVPSGTVVPVKLDEELSSKDTRVGETFTATVVGGPEAAGLPDGTKIEGVVRDAVPSRDGKPGVLDVDFRRVLLPEGGSQPVEASLASLDSKDITRTSSGRLEARRGSSGNDRLKWVGIGAGAGLLISSVLGGNRLLDTVLGAGAGYLYSQLQKKGAGDVRLGRGTEIGVRLDQRLAYSYPMR